MTRTLEVVCFGLERLQHFQIRIDMDLFGSVFSIEEFSSE
jgi:hypothetical protein